MTEGWYYERRVLDRWTPVWTARQPDVVGTNVLRIKSANGVGARIKAKPIPMTREEWDNIVPERT
jgi:hypothetical protein